MTQPIARPQACVVHSGGGGIDLGAVVDDPIRSVSPAATDFPPLLLVWQANLA